MSTKKSASGNLFSFIFLISIYCAFFASGASCLFAEVTWNRMLIVIVGNSLSATAMIIVVFMGGLGLGSYTAGKVIGKRRPSLVPYLLMELFIGVYIFLSPWLFDVLSRTFSVWAEHTSSSTGLTLVRIIVSLAALLLPAFLMGATFPAMIAGAVPDSPEKRSARIGFLYSINTLGAAVGCFVAGYGLLFEYGVKITLTCAFCLNIFAALCALLANIVKKPFTCEDTLSPQPQVDEQMVDSRLRRYLKVSTFGIGFVALAYEVLLTRLGILYLGNTTKVFALVLTAFLLGTGISAVLGTWIYGVLQRNTKFSTKLFGSISLAAGVLVLSTPYTLLSSSNLASNVRLLPTSNYNPLPDLMIIIGPTIMLGALLPIAIRMLHPGKRDEATEGAATLYALNTAGGLLGAGLINHVFVPLVGLQVTLICLASICAAVGIIGLLSPRTSFTRWLFVIAGVAGFALVLSVSLPNIMKLYAKKVAKSTLMQNVDTLLLHEGRAATVTVDDVHVPRLGTYRDMFLNGVEEASTRYWHVQLFKLLGAFPVLMHESDKPKDALVIAFGAGITAGSVLASDEVASLDVVDLNPDIEGINNLFKDVNGDVFHKPRFHFHVDDGRNYLVTNSKKYDLIISDSTHPRSYDSWILYTQEFYRDVKKRLKPDGIFAQWVPVDPGMRGELFRIHLNTFRSVFPNATFWYVYGSDQAFLLATPGHFTLDTQRLQQKLDRLPAWFRAHDYQIDTAERIAGFFWLDEAKMSQMIGNETRVNTDNLHYFDKVSAIWPVKPELQLPHFQASILPYLKQPDDKLRTAINREQNTAQALTNYYFFYNVPDLLAAYCLLPHNGNVRYWTAIEYPDGMPNVSCK